MLTAPWLRLSLPLATCVLLVSTVAWMRVPLLPAIGEDLGIDATGLGWVVTAFGAGRLLMDLPAGRLADRIPPLRLFTLAALVMAAGSLLFALASLPAVVVAASVLVGIGSATSNTTGMATMSAVAPPERRGSAMALYSGALLTGQALGPAVAGVVAGVGGWRVAAGTAAAVALVVAGAAVAASRLEVGRGGRSARQAGSEDHAPLTAAQRLVLVSVAFNVFFTVAALPQMLIPLIGARELDLGPALIGLALGAGGLARIVGTTGTGYVSDRVSRRAALLPCLALQAAGVALLVRAEAAWWLAAILLMSLGSSGHSVGATMLGDRTRAGEIGRALGRYRFVGDMGLVVGPVLVGWVYELAGRVAAVSLVTTLLVVGLIAAWAVLPETRHRSPAATGPVPR